MAYQQYVKAQDRIPKTIPRDENGLPMLPKHSGIYQMHLEACATMDKASGLREGIKCPQERVNDEAFRDEWVAVQVWHCFQKVDYVNCMLRCFCWDKKCPRMNAGENVFYGWHDEATDSVCEICARDYMQNTVVWGHNKLTDQSFMPILKCYSSCEYKPIPHERFWSEVKKIMRRFFRIYAHGYLSHYADIKAHAASGGDDVEAGLNFAFKHFIFVVKEFDLVEDADMVPLKQLIDKFMRMEDERTQPPKVFIPPSMNDYLHNPPQADRTYNGQGNFSRRLKEWASIHASVKSRYLQAEGVDAESDSDRSSKGPIPAAN